ncbi:hypothetical protein [Streptomyces sp. NPDC002952]|uniref:hypothetical protein n=1 Tax=Streptomyces sp. NPDC002952 TaxID=3364673 RepID=UPI0036B9476A
MATSTYSSYDPNGSVNWRFRCEKQLDPNDEESYVVFQGDANPDSGGVPQAAIDDLAAAGWRVIVSKDRNHTATLDTAAPVA